MVWTPSANGAVGTQAHAPLGSTGEVQIVVVPSSTVIVAPGSPRPMTVGVRVVTVPPSGGERMVGGTCVTIATTVNELGVLSALSPAFGPVDVAEIV